MGTWRSNTVQRARAAAAQRAEARILAGWRPLVTALLLGLLALPPRAFGLADYFTTDEAYHWITRTERFSAAISAGRWADTVLTGHPGVTNMWLGSLGLWLERALGADPGAAPPLLAHLAWLRLPGALLQTLLVPAAYLILRRLVTPATALVACVLWACSPYLIAHSRLLHLDALLTSFVTFSVLLLLEATSADLRPPAGAASRRWPLVASGVFAGLALLTKGPALILLPFAGLVLLATGGPQPSDLRRPAALAARLWPVVARYILWLAAALLTVLALWPALWVDPSAALGRYIDEIVSNGGRPNGDGQFFLGVAAADPGPWFYVLADLFRTTPLMLAGLIAFIGFSIADLRSRRAPTPERRALLVLLALVAFWTLVMTLGPKKFDRYVLPTWPALIVLCAAGLTRAADWLRQLRQRSERARPPAVVERLAVGLVVALELWQPLSVHPYYLSYYNPLLGGGAVAQRLFLIGWGEGMDQVGAWLRSRPDLSYGPVLSALGRTLQPFVPVDVRDVEDYGRLPANYAVVYLESVQRGAHPEIYRALQDTIPLHTVTIHGIEYARIHQLPRPFDRPLDVWFGDGLRLRGVTVAQEPGRVVVTPAWDVRAPLAGDYHLFMHVIDAQGTRVAQVSVPPGGAEMPPTSSWQPGQQVAVPIPIDLPELPAGEYMLTLGVYDTATMARLPLRGGTAAPEPAGDNALLLETLRLP